MVTREDCVALFYPRRCPICGKVTDALPLCTECEPKVRRCYRNPPRLPENDYNFLYLEGAASVYRYGGLVAPAILNMKYGGSPWRADGFGRLMARQLFGAGIYTSGVKSDILKQNKVPGKSLGYSCIVPVPATRFGDEHIPGMLAAALSRELGIPVLKALRKTTRTPRQEELGYEERLLNLWGSFGIRKGVDVEAKSILLVDDVITTGTTVSACAQTLIKAGADSVFAVSIAAAGEKPPPEEQT